MNESRTPPRILRFSQFSCDVCTGELHKDGVRVRLPDQPFRLLATLLERPGEVVTRKELKEHLWPNQSYGDFNDGLNTAVNKLRAALDDKAEHPQFIETIPRRGYRFIGKAETFEPGGDAAATPTSKQHPLWLRHAWLAALAAAFAGVLATGLILHFTKASAHGQTHRISLAVLPFRNLTGHPGNDYLADGFTQEIISRFGRNYGGEVRVIGHDSAMSAERRQSALPQIAAELGVQYVLRGGLQSEGPHLRVTVQLLRVQDHSTLWADSYDGDASQLLDFEDSVLRSVARELSLKLPPGGVRFHLPRTFAAHDDYLRGLYEQSKRNRPGLQGALEDFAAATVQDPHYARAYAELAVTYNLMGEYNMINPAYAHSLGKAAAEQAISSDPALAEAHAALGFSEWFYEWNSDAAAQELRRAIQLEPDNVDARHWYSQVLMTSGRFEESQRQMQAALSLDPKSLILRTNLGWLHYFERRYPLAIRELREVIRQKPDFLTAHYKLWEVYSVSGHPADAWRECRHLVHTVYNPNNEDRILSAYREGGYAAALKKFAVLSGTNFRGDTVDAARCMIFAGDQKRAAAFLQQAYSEKDGWMVFVPIDPAFDPLRSQPQFVHLGLAVRNSAGKSPALLPRP